MNLVGGGRRPLKQRQSYVRESALLRRSGSPVFALHQPIICGRSAERDAIPVVINAHTSKCAGPSDKTFEVIYMRRIPIRSGGLIVAAILVEPWNRVRFGPAICRT